MLQTYAMWGANSRNWITYQGKVLVHQDKGELEFLCPGQNVRPITLEEKDAMSILKHPQFASVKTPIQKEDFWW